MTGNEMKFEKKKYFYNNNNNKTILYTKMNFRRKNKSIYE